MNTRLDRQNFDRSNRHVADPLFASRIRTIEVGTLSMIAFAVPFVFINWIMVSEVMGLLLAGLIGICILVLVVLRRTQDASLCGHLGTASFFVYLMAANAVAGGFYQPGVGWLLLIPLAAALLVDIRGGWIWAGIVSVGLVALWASSEMGWMLPSQISAEARPTYFLASLLGAVVAVGVLASSFTRTQRKLEESLRETNERIEHMAYYDALTGLPNRLLFRDRLEVALARATRTGRTIGLLFIDLNEFKTVNDTLGHGVGDDLLKEVSLRFSDAVRLSDTISHVEAGLQESDVSRLGGDEFTVLLGDVTGEEGAEIVARRLLAALGEPLVVQGSLLAVSASIGIALSPQEGGDADALLREADSAMYRAKARGQNQFEFAAAVRP